MKAASKKFFFVLLSTLLISMLVPVSASAENPNSTLGTETPYMYCTFIDAEGREVDGNSLVSGDYTVDVRVGEMENASILQFTAEYDSSVITDLAVTRTIADDAGSDVSLGGIKDENNILVVALASEDNNASALTDEFGTSIATMDVSVDAGENDAVDFEDVFSFSNDPDLTFLEADYADGYDDAYVTDVNASATYNTYLMTADASPDFLTVSGKVVIANSLDGESGSVGIGDIAVYSDVNFEPLAISTDNGTFTAAVPRGTKNLIFTNYSFENGEHAVDSQGSTIDRMVAINGKQNVSSTSVIPIIVCDYNKDGAVTPADKVALNSQINKTVEDGDYKAVYNLNGDNAVTPADKVIFNLFSGKIGKDYTYTERMLQ